MSPGDQGRQRTEAGADGAVRSLLDSTEALERALTGGEDDLVDALEARGRAFAALRECVRAPLSPSDAALIERVLAIDGALLTRAEVELHGVRAELAQSRRSRGVLQRLDADAAPPRFVSERA